MIEAAKALLSFFWLRFFCLSLQNYWSLFSLLIATESISLKTGVLSRWTYLGRIKFDKRNKIPHPILGLHGSIWMRKDNTLNLASTEVPTLYQKNVAINIYVRRTTAGLHVTKAHHNVRTGTTRTRACVRASVSACIGMKTWKSGAWARFSTTRRSSASSGVNIEPHFLFSLFCY